MFLKSLYVIMSEALVSRAPVPHRVEPRGGKAIAPLSAMPLLAALGMANCRKGIRLVIGTRRHVANIRKQLVPVIQRQPSPDLSPFGAHWLVSVKLPATVVPRGTKYAFATMNDTALAAVALKDSHRRSWTSA
jgi:hypothetical protein